MIFIEVRELVRVSASFSLAGSIFLCAALLWQRPTTLARSRQLLLLLFHLSTADALFAGSFLLSTASPIGPRRCFAGAVTNESFAMVTALLTCMFARDVYHSIESSMDNEGCHHGGRRVGHAKRELGAMVALAWGAPLGLEAFLVFARRHLQTNHMHRNPHHRYDHHYNDRMNVFDAIVIETKDAVGPSDDGWRMPWCHWRDGHHVFAWYLVTALALGYLGVRYLRFRRRLRQLASPRLKDYVCAAAAI